MSRRKQSNPKPLIKSEYLYENYLTYKIYKAVFLKSNWKKPAYNWLKIRLVKYPI